LVKLGRLAAARPHLDLALTVARELGNPQAEGLWLGGLGGLHLRGERLTAAQACFDQALERLSHPGGERFRLSVLPNLVRLCLRRGDLSRAREVLDEANALADAVALGPGSVTAVDLAEVRERVANIQSLPTR
ncbi:MAG: tetratricopeptide repeat protein, partial [Myxococcota bacterium]